MDALDHGVDRGARHVEDRRGEEAEAEHGDGHRGDEEALAGAQFQTVIFKNVYFFQQMQSSTGRDGGGVGSQGASIFFGPPRAARQMRWFVGNRERSGSVMRARTSDV